MPQLSALAFAILAGSASVLALPAAPAVTPKAALHPYKRSNSSSGSACTFSGSDGAASASASKTDCATIVLDSVAVPSGTTLDLTVRHHLNHERSIRLTK